MSSAPEKAVEAARSAILSGPIGDPAERALEAAYPIIRAEVIAEVVGALRSPALSDFVNGPREAADFIEREFS